MLPKDSEDRVQLDADKCKEWLGKGARPTDRVARFLSTAGLWEWKAGNNPNKGKPGAKAQQLIIDRKEKEEARKERKLPRQLKKPQKPQKRKPKMHLLRKRLLLRTRPRPRKNLRKRLRKIRLQLKRPLQRKRLQTKPLLSNSD